MLYAGCFFWTLGYDTIYALQDMEDDALAGVKSTARLFGRHSRNLDLSVLRDVLRAFSPQPRDIGFHSGLAALLLIPAQASISSGNCAGWTSKIRSPA